MVALAPTWKPVPVTVMAVVEVWLPVKLPMGNSEGVTAVICGPVTAAPVTV